MAKTESLFHDPVLPEVAASTPLPDIGHDSFRAAMSGFPSGLTIVTTVEDDGTWRGFTASSFCAVSLSPPMVLVCLAKSAGCHAAFQQSGRFAVNVLPESAGDLARSFGDSRGRKFAGGEFAPGVLGLPVLPDAVVVLECQTEERFAGGDHSVLLGRVKHARTGHGRPAVYWRRGIHRLSLPDGPTVYGDPTSP